MTFTVSEDQMTAVLTRDDRTRVRLTAVPFPHGRGTRYIVRGGFRISERCSLCALCCTGLHETACSLPDGVSQRCYGSRKDGLPHHWEETT